MTRLVLASPAPVNLELHAIDFLDRTDPGVEPELVARQPDLRVPTQKKLERLAKAIRMIADQRQVVRLEQLARATMVPRA